MSEDVGAVGPEADEGLFGENMRQIREEREWSQGELARRMQTRGWTNFHQTTVSRIEKGERPVRLGEARAIARVLRTSVDNMLRPPEEVWRTAAMQERWERTDRALGKAVRDLAAFWREQRSLGQAMADDAWRAAMPDHLRDDAARIAELSEEDVLASARKQLAADDTQSEAWQERRGYGQR